MRGPLLFCSLLLATAMLAPRPAAASTGDAACMEDSCQACGMGGACFSNMLAQCRHPACVLLGLAGGTVGAVGGGILGPLVLTVPALVMYPDLHPTTAVIGSVFVGAGLGCVAGGLPGMLCGTMIGESWQAAWRWPWEPPPEPRRGRQRRQRR